MKILNIKKYKIYPTKNNLYVVKEISSEQSGIIDEDGNFVLPVEQFINVYAFSVKDRYIVIQKDQKVGIFDTNIRHLMLESKYESIKNNGIID